MCYVRNHHLFANPKIDLTHNETEHNRVLKLKQINKYSHYFQNLFCLIKVKANKTK